MTLQVSLKISFLETYLHPTGPFLVQIGLKRLKKQQQQQQHYTKSATPSCCCTQSEATLKTRGGSNKLFYVRQYIQKQQHIRTEERKRKYGVEVTARLRRSDPLNTRWSLSPLFDFIGRNSTLASISVYCIMVTFLYFTQNTHTMFRK